MLHVLYMYVFLYEPFQCKLQTRQLALKKLNVWAQWFTPVIPGLLGDQGRWITFYFLRERWWNFLDEYACFYRLTSKMSNSHSGFKTWRILIGTLIRFGFKCAACKRKRVVLLLLLNQSIWQFFKYWNLFQICLNCVL